MKKIQIESRMVGEIALGSIIPAAVKYQNALIENIKGIKEIASVFVTSGATTAKASKKAVLAGGEEESEHFSSSNGSGINEMISAQVDTIKKLSVYISAIRTNVYKMIEARKKANNLKNAEEQANAYCENVKPYFDEIRYHADKMEFIVDDELWALPKYREMLFTR